MVLAENGYHDVPAGKLAAITTSLQMLARPPLRPEADAPGRLRRVMAPEALAGLSRHPAVEVYALRVGERDEGLIELDFREPDVCELRMFGVTAQLIGTGAGRWLMNRASEAPWAT